MFFFLPIDMAGQLFVQCFEKGVKYRTSIFLIIKMSLLLLLPFIKCFEYAIRERNNNLSVRYAILLCE